MFLYYLSERRNIPSLDELKTVGLGYAFDRQPEAAGVQGGPDGGSGMVLCQAPDTTVRVGYYPDDQQWIHVAETPAGPPHEYWIGFAPDAPPTPAGLARMKQLAGHMIPMGDGHEWRIPTAILLPKAYVFTPGAGWSCTLDEVYSWLWAEAERVQKAYAEAAAGVKQGETFIVRVDPEDVALAARLLALNYRVSEFELSALRVLTSDVVPAVMGALLDEPTLKKKDPLTASDSSGPG